MKVNTIYADAGKVQYLQGRTQAIVELLQGLGIEGEVTEELSKEEP